MVRKIAEKEISNAEKLFAGWDETMIWSCLQGVMGEIYVAEEKTGQEGYKSAVAILGAFAFFAGEANRELVLFKPDSYQGDFVIMVPQNQAWKAMIEECYPECCKQVERYALRRNRKSLIRKSCKRW